MIIQYIFSAVYLYTYIYFIICRKWTRLYLYIHCDGFKRCQVIVIIQLLGKQYLFVLLLNFDTICTHYSASLSQISCYSLFPHLLFVKTLRWCWVQADTARGWEVIDLIAVVFGAVWAWHFHRPSAASPSWLTGQRKLPSQ